MAHDEKIENRFRQLLAQLETETGQRPTYSEIQQKTEIAESILSSYAQGKVKRYDEKTLIRLVDYFDERLKGGCKLSDLISYPPVNGQELYSSTNQTEMVPA